MANSAGAIPGWRNASTTSDSVAAVSSGKIAYQGRVSMPPGAPSHQSS